MLKARSLRLAMVAVGATATTLSACGPLTEAESLLHSDSGIRGPAYSNIVTTMKDLATNNSSLFSVISYGQTAGGREMVMVRIGNSATSTTKRPGVLITGSIHGDEFLGVENNLPKWIADNRTTSPGLKKFLDGNGVVYIVPIQNPDGYDKRQRGNTTGTDLNRDYDGQTEGVKNFRNPETKNFTDALKQNVASSNVELKVTMDYHCCIGGIIYPWSHKTTKLPDQAHQEHVDIVKGMAKYFNYKTGQPHQIVGYTASGSSMDYFYEMFGSRSFAFEGVVRTEDKNFSKHTSMWDEIFGKYALEPTTPAPGGGAPTPGGGAPTPGTPTTPGGSTSANPLFLYISKDYGNGQIMAQLSASRASTMKLCEGTKDSCSGTGAKIVAEYFYDKTVGDRMLFKSQQSFQVSSQETIFTILAYGQTNELLSAESIKITKTNNAKTGS